MTTWRTILETTMLAIATATIVITHMQPTAELTYPPRREYAEQTSTAQLQDGMDKTAVHVQTASSTMMKRAWTAEEFLGFALGTVPRACA
jgi:hypothetical protein